MLAAKIIVTWLLVSAVSSLIIGFFLWRIGREDEVSAMRHEHAMSSKKRSGTLVLERAQRTTSEAAFASFQARSK